MSKNAIVEKYAIFGNHNDVARRTANIPRRMFYKNRKLHSVQDAFHKKFKLKRHDSVPSCVTISKRVKTFQETSAATLVGMVERKRSIQTVEN